MSKRSYGSIGVNISDMARDLAQAMIKAGQESKALQREEEVKARWESRDPDVYLIGRRTSTGRFVVEGVEDFKGLGQITGSGPNEQCAVANARMLVAAHFKKVKVCRTMLDAQIRVSKMDFRVMDVIDGTGLGSTTGKISVGAGGKR